MVSQYHASNWGTTMSQHVIAGSCARSCFRFVSLGLSVPLILASVFGAASTVDAQAADPNLIAVNVTFVLPKCDDRDDDTKINMSVVNGGTVIAQTDNMAPGQQFKDPGTYGPFPIALSTAITKSTYPSTTTKLHIEPHGHDTWCTRIDVDALFADNTHIKTGSCNVVKVSEANKDYQFQNSPCQ